MDFFAKVVCGIAFIIVGIIVFVFWARRRHLNQSNFLADFGDNDYRGIIPYGIALAIIIGGINLWHTGVAERTYCVAATVDGICAYESTRQWPWDKSPTVN